MLILKLSVKNAENDYFDWRLECAAPKRWSKYTTIKHSQYQFLFYQFKFLFYEVSLIHHQYRADFGRQWSCSSQATPVSPAAILYF